MSDPIDYPRVFATRFGAQDSVGMAALFTEDGSLHSLTGQFATGTKAIEAALNAEFEGLTRMARGDRQS